MNIASHRIPPIPACASSSAPGDCAGGWKWGSLNVDKDPSIGWRSKSSGFCNVVLSWDPVEGSGGDADAPSARMLKEAVKLKFPGGRAPSPIGRLVRWGREEGVGVN